MNKTIINQYVKEVSSELCCERKVKKQFLNELRSRLEDFAETTAEGSLNRELLTKEFDSPQEISDSFLLEIEPSLIRSQLKLSGKTKKIIFFIILAAVVLIVAFILYQIYIDHLLMSGYAIERIYDGTFYEDPNTGSYRSY